MIQALSITGSILILLIIIHLIAKRKLKEEYSLLWLFFGMVFLTLSIWREGLDVIAGIVGIAYAPATLFLVLIMAVYVILLHYSVVISKLTENNRRLIQEVGILAYQVKEMRKELSGNSGEKASEPGKDVEGPVSGARVHGCD